MTADAPVRITPGLCSITLRREPAHQIVSIAARAGLRTVEWGADVHVPPGAAEIAARTRGMTEGAGLLVASYGSYHHLGADEPTEVPVLIDTAQRLRAPRIRVWAGLFPSAKASAKDRSAVVEATRRAADIAAQAGIEIAFEYHGGTLTDDPGSTVDLLDEVDRPNVSTYWQPPVGMHDDDAITSLRRVLPHVHAIHVFSWWPGEQRHPLRARDRLWRSVFDLLHEEGRAFQALLEFVPDDDAGGVITEAQALHRLIQGTG